ncbi:hypothetical protein E2C01_100936 [Portunus trituberculatus]|uniref:Uncharacterized protein n=1 Tax=Portunus trituberculatus TaxID=210409 RepID=A0A5B7KKR1_PORTR|nr:hypothetical protein [Portunus trituberculatus]
MILEKKKAEKKNKETKPQERGKKFHLGKKMLTTFWKSLKKTVEKKRKALGERTSRKRFHNSTPLKEPSSTEEENSELLNSSHSSIISIDDTDKDEEIEGV